MKNWLITLLVLSSLTACEPAAKAWDSAKGFAQNWTGVAAPNARELTVPLPKISPEELNLTAQTYVRTASPTAFTPQILHFDAAGKLSNQPTPNGYYREVYGQMADGRLLAQDFFEATKLPQTTTLLLKNGSSPQDFTNGILDGRVIWFNQAGELHALADYANGVAQGARVFFQNKQVVGATLAQKMLAFHQDGTILAIMENDNHEAKSPADTWQFTLFRPNGMALMQTRIRGEQVQDAIAWSNDGKQIRRKADVQAVRQESLPIEKRADEILRLMYE